MQWSNENKMDFLKLAENRVSIRNYDPDRFVASEQLRLILEAGRLAPSAANRQPWRFYLVSSPEKLSKVRSCDHRVWFKDAPHILIVAGYRKAAWERSDGSLNTLETDLAIAMDHMILAAASLGIGSCWIVAFDPGLLRNNGILQDDEEVIAITPLGYPKEGFHKSDQKIGKSFEEVVRFV